MLQEMIYLDSTIPIYNYSLMKVEKYVKEEYLIPYAYVKKTEVNIEIDMRG